MKIVLLAGAPGSGKSTQGTALMNMNAHFKHLSLGEVVRDIIKNPTHPLTVQYAELIKSGNLLPDAVILEILKTELSKIGDENKVILLDGYPRTQKQYEEYKKFFGMPAGLIHLNSEEQVLRERLTHRNTQRLDDNANAIEYRLNTYREITMPLLDQIKSDLKKHAFTVSTHQDIKSTSLFLYTQLQRIPEIHELLANIELDVTKKLIVDSQVKPIWTYSAFAKLWETGNEYQSIESIQKNYDTRNFSFSLLGKKVVYLETADAIKVVLNARSKLGPVYRHFSMAAGLQHDFVARDSHEAKSYQLDNGQVNVWKLIHQAFSKVVKEDKQTIEDLMDKYIDQILLCEKSFILDTTFDTFFCSFWSEYLFGNKVSASLYMENREQILKAMKQCFYENHYKGLDPTGLSSVFYAYAVHQELEKAKERLKQFIAKASPYSLIQRFKTELVHINHSESLGLSEETLNEIIEDNVFDFIFEPDFLENVMYETLVAAIKENADLRNNKVRQDVYHQGIYNGYLFPIRSRVLEEQVNLEDGTILSPGTLVYFNLKKSGLYHSAGPRRCVGQAYTHYFKDHLFKRLEAIEFEVKEISYPVERQVSNENVPVSPERFQVSWHLKRDEAMRHLSSHHYKGNRFFDVLGLHEKPDLNSLMVKQCVLKIKRLLEKQHINIHEVVIATPEVRGIPLASQVANSLGLPLYVIRKEGGYKMAANEVYRESYDKGYGDPDTVELPIQKVKELSGKKVIFIDDGIASGKSAIACIKLIEEHNEKPAQVPLVLSLLKHDYTNMDPKLSEHYLVKTLFDCKAKENAVTSVDEGQKMELKI